MRQGGDADGETADHQGKVEHEAPPCVLLHLPDVLFRTSVDMARHGEPVGRIRAVGRQWRDPLTRGEDTAGQRGEPTSSTADGRAGAADCFRQRTDPGEVTELAPTPLASA